MEYESRRDADDAYHEMHNKRIGRDDVLKIEVDTIMTLRSSIRSLTVSSGLEHPLLHPGDLTLGVIVAHRPVVNALLVVARTLLRAAAEVTILRGRMTVVTETTIDVIAIDPEALTTVIGR